MLRALTSSIPAQMIHRWLNDFTNHSRIAPAVSLLRFLYVILVPTNAPISISIFLANPIPAAVFADTNAFPVAIAAFNLAQV